MVPRKEAGEGKKKNMEDSGKGEKSRERNEKLDSYTELKGKK